MNNAVMNPLENYILKMIDNKSLNNDYKLIQVTHNMILSVVKLSFVKVTHNKSLSLSKIKVKHNKTAISKDKTIDYLENVINTLTKPVDKIHISNFMLMGKKNKKQKKTKKIKVKKS